MSKLKKFVSSVATAAILVSGISTASFATISGDVHGTDYEEAAKVLGAFEIMVGDAGTGMFRPHDPIKRSEVTKVAVALKGLSSVANSSASTKFPDVEKGHWATGYINVGTTEGLIIGDDKGNFRPDDNITYSEAITILVRALGYEPQAQAKGGYPTGYLVSGNSMGLTTGVSAAQARSASAVSRGQIAQLAYNALGINLMEQVGFGSGAKYEITDDTLLTSRLDAKLVKGKVTAVGSSSLEGSGVDKGQIEIDGKVYKTGKADVRNVLGLYVDAYITDKSSSKDNNTVKAIVPSLGENDITTIFAQDIAEITSSASGKEISYFKGSKKYKISIPQNSLIVYNGKASDIDDLKVIKSGTIMIADDDKKTVFINETENYVVDEVILSSDRVIDKYGKSPLVLDEEDDKLTFVLEKDNKITDISALKEWDVITLTMSKDKSVIYGTVINNPVEGKITEIDDEYVYVGDKKFMVSPSYTEKIEIDDEGIFYLDQEGKIAAFDEGKLMDRNYAYISGIDTKTGLNQKLELEIFDMQGKLSHVTAASKVSVDGKLYTTVKTISDAIGGTEQLVTVKFNSKGELSEVTKASKGDIDEDKFVLNFSEDDVVYNAKTSKLLASDMEIRVGADTIVFDLPAGGDSEDYAIAGKSFFSDGDKYDITAYDVREDMTAGVIVVTSSENKASEDSSAVVVDKLTNYKDEDGNNAEKLYAYQSGERITLTAKTGTFKKGSQKLEAGDIIQVKADSKGKVKAIEVLFDIDTKDKEISKKISDNLTLEYGKVVKKFDDSFNLSVNSSNAKNYTIGDAKIHVVDTSKKTGAVSVGSASDIQKFDDANPERVFVRIYKDTVEDIIVIK